MKLLIIGGGAVSEAFHIPSAIKLLGKEKIFVAESSEKQQKYLKSKFGLQNLSTNYNDILNKADAVIIATPPHIHAKIIADCFVAEKPVLCEKPVFKTSKEGFQLLKQNKKTVLSGICHTYRLFGNRIFVRKLIQEGYFGTTPHIEINEGAPADWPTLSGYCFRKDLVSGGVLMDSGIHSLDYILWCLGDVRSCEYQDDAIGGLESNASMQISFENNATANFRISRTCDLSNTITISGEKKSIVLEIFEMNKIIEDGVERELTLDEMGENPQLNWKNIGEHQIKSFIDSIQNKSAVFCPIEDGIKVIETIERCYKIKSKRALPTKAGIPGLRF